MQPFMEDFSQKWFTMYYLSLGALISISGIVLILSYQRVRNYLMLEAETETPPVAIRNLLKYLFLFTIPCLVLSFVPFSWIELLFSLWSLFIVYIAGIQLVRWDESRKLIKKNPDRLEWYLRLTGAMMVAVGLVILSLGYIVLNQIDVF